MDSRLKKEIQHGAYLSSTDPGTIWNWSSPAGRIRFHRRAEMLTAPICKIDKVLEVGCGTGLLTSFLMETGADITAIDVSKELLDIAESRINSKNLIFKLENAYATNFPDSYFDFVVGSSVLHHLDLEKALKEFQRILKPNGVIRFTEPNMLNPQIFLQKNIPWLKRKMGDSPDEMAFVRYSLKKIMKKNNFVNVQIIPFDFLHPATPSMLIPFVNGLGNIFEKIPVLKEIAGSVYIVSSKKLDYKKL